MQTWVKIAAAAGLLLLAGLVYYLRLDSFPNDLASRTKFDTVMMCRACNQSYAATLSKDDTYPLTCTKCGKKEAWPQKQCYKCGLHFVPQPEGQPPHMPVAPHCPKCGSEAVGAVVPGNK